MIEASTTSVWAALGRAFGAREPDPGVRNPDWLAEKLVGPEERTVMQEHPLRTALDRPFEEAVQDMEVVTASRSMIPRTRFIDERLEGGVRNGATQVVILGAGFDSRAYRLRELLASARVYEVDHPATQELKRRRVREVIADVPTNLTFLPVDFRTDDLNAKLASVGYRADQRTFFVWEGVTMYLPEESVRTTLKWIAGCSAPGSAVVFDYFSEMAVRVMANPDAFAIPAEMKKGIELFKRLNPDEPFLFGVPDGNVEQLVSSTGLALRRVLGLNSAEAVETYLTRADGSLYGNLPATPQQGYFILEASVPE